MARLSRRLSRYFSLSRRSQPKIHKSHISKPLIPSDLNDDTQHLLVSDSDKNHIRTPSQSPSAHTLSDAELHSLEQQHLQRGLEGEIDSIIAAYEGIPHTPRDQLATYSPPLPVSHSSTSNISSAVCSSPSPSSTYSSPPSTPSVGSPKRARIQIFRDTPPPAPGWERVCFGRETALFGPETRGLGMQGTDSVVMGDEGRAGRRKDWRGEFGRRGYGVL